MKKPPSVTPNCRKTKRADKRKGAEIKAEVRNLQKAGSEAGGRVVPETFQIWGEKS